MDISYESGCITTVKHGLHRMPVQHIAMRKILPNTTPVNKL